MLLNHSALEFSTVGKRTLRVRDRTDLTAATVDFDISETGCLVACRAERPRLVGKHSVPTPWSGTCTEFREWEGMRVVRLIEASWHLPEGSFTYYRSEITSYKLWP
jgi:hypothetical protein